MMTDFPRLSGATAPSALSRRKSDSANPPSASPPALRKPRREIPSQKRSRSPLKNVNMGNPCREEYTAITPNARTETAQVGVRQGEKSRGERLRPLSDTHEYFRRVEAAELVGRLPGQQPLCPSARSGGPVE